MRGLVALSMLFVLHVLVGCGASLPSEDAAKQALENHITKENANRLNLVSFHKTNGVQSEAGGVPHYTIEFEGELEVMEDCFWVGPESWAVTGGAGEYVATCPTERAFGVCVLRVKKGLRRKILGNVKFEKAENGWRSVTIGGSDIRFPT